MEMEMDGSEVGGKSATTDACAQERLITGSQPSHSHSQSGARVFDYAESESSTAFSGSEHRNPLPIPSHHLTSTPTSTSTAATQTPGSGHFPYKVTGGEELLLVSSFSTGTALRRIGASTSAVNGNEQGVYIRDTDLERESRDAKRSYDHDIEEHAQLQSDMYMYQKTTTGSVASAHGHGHGGMMSMGRSVGGGYGVMDGHGAGSEDGFGFRSESRAHVDEVESYSTRRPTSTFTSTSTTTGGRVENLLQHQHQQQDQPLHPQYVGHHHHHRSDAYSHSYDSTYNNTYSPSLPQPHHQHQSQSQTQSHPQYQSQSQFQPQNLISGSASASGSGSGTGLQQLQQLQGAGGVALLRDAPGSVSTATSTVTSTPGLTSMSTPGSSGMSSATSASYVGYGYADGYGYGHERDSYERERRDYVDGRDMVREHGRATRKRPHSSMSNSPGSVDGSGFEAEGEGEGESSRARSRTRERTRTRTRTRSRSNSRSRTTTSHDSSSKSTSNSNPKPKPKPKPKSRMESKSRLDWNPHPNPYPHQQSIPNTSPKPNSSSNLRPNPNTNPNNIRFAPANKVSARTRAGSSSGSGSSSTSNTTTTTNSTSTSTSTSTSKKPTRTTRTRSSAGDKEWDERGVGDGDGDANANANGANEDAHEDNYPRTGGSTNTNTTLRTSSSSSPSTTVAGTPSSSASTPTSALSSSSHRSPHPNPHQTKQSSNSQGGANSSNSNTPATSNSNTNTTTSSNTNTTNTNTTNTNTPTNTNTTSSNPNTGTNTSKTHKRAKLQLASDQPMTTLGKERERVFVACVQCRTRKIRCTGGKPACFNCEKRGFADVCCYDKAPKRRGPDRNPGKRVRSGVVGTGVGMGTGMGTVGVGGGMGTREGDVGTSRSGRIDIGEDGYGTGAGMGTVSNTFISASISSNTPTTSTSTLTTPGSSVFKVVMLDELGLAADAATAAAYGNGNSYGNGDDGDNDAVERKKSGSTGNTGIVGVVRERSIGGAMRGGSSAKRGRRDGPTSSVPSSIPSAASTVSGGSSPRDAGTGYTRAPSHMRMYDSEVERLPRVEGEQEQEIRFTFESSPRPPLLLPPMQSLRDGVGGGEYDDDAQARSFSPPPLPQLEHAHSYGSEHQQQLLHFQNTTLPPLTYALPPISPSSSSSLPFSVDVSPIAHDSDMTLSAGIGVGVGIGGVGGVGVGIDTVVGSIASTTPEIAEFSLPRSSLPSPVLTPPMYPLQQQAQVQPHAQVIQNPVTPVQTMHAFEGNETLALPPIPVSTGFTYDNASLGSANMTAGYPQEQYHSPGTYLSPPFESAGFGIPQAPIRGYDAGYDGANAGVGGYYPGQLGGATYGMEGAVVSAGSGAGAGGFGYGDVLDQPYVPYYGDQNDEYANAQERQNDIAPSPSLEFIKKTWWDALLTFYLDMPVTPALHSTISTSPNPSSLLLVPSSSLHTLSPQSKIERATIIITAHLKHLFKKANYWVAFINVPNFAMRFFSGERDEVLQPCLVLSMLALSVLMQSSELEMGAEGRKRAMALKDRAQAAFEASVCAQWYNVGLVQAAWLMALFELCSHPLLSYQRTHSVLHQLDSVIRIMRLTELDEDDQSVTTFKAGEVPRLKYNNDDGYGGMSQLGGPAAGLTPPIYDASYMGDGLGMNTIVEPPLLRHLHLPAYPVDPLSAAQNPYLPNSRPPQPPQPQPPQSYNHPPEPVDNPTCACETLSLGQNWEAVNHVAPLWVYTPMWARHWTEQEIEMEEKRRLVWTTLTLVAGYTNFMTAFDEPFGELYVCDAWNYRLLFPGESLLRSHLPPDSHPSAYKDTVWALYSRAMLLWNMCVRMRSVGGTDQDRARWAQAVWEEADEIEEALNKHRCHTEKACMWHSREYLFNSRMWISNEFRRYVPYPATYGQFDRRKAEEWLHHQAHIGKRIMDGLEKVTGHKDNPLAHRPFFLYWFMSEVARCLKLWNLDRSLLLALDLSKALLAPIDYLTALWPCEVQRVEYARLLHHLTDACILAGVPPPQPRPSPLASSN